MATLTLKNVPPHLVERLQEVAGRHGRSLNTEALMQLKQALDADEDLVFSGPQTGSRREVSDAPLLQRGRFLEIDGFIESATGDPVAEVRAERTDQVAGR